MLPGNGQKDVPWILPRCSVVQEPRANPRHPSHPPLNKMYTCTSVTGQIPELACLVTKPIWSKMSKKKKKAEKKDWKEKG
jgi:hypothetical protein